jgi:hypothetical protein
MKTFRFLIFLCFIAAFTVNNVKAQNSVVKEEVIVEMGGQLLDCTGDYLWGEIITEQFFMKNNWLAFSKKVDVKGYIDPEGTNPSGNVYQFNQMGTFPGGNGYETTGTVQLNGKNIGTFHGRFHMTENANGQITAYIDTWWIKCR